VRDAVVGDGRARARRGATWHRARALDVDVDVVVVVE